MKNLIAFTQFTIRQFTCDHPHLKGRVTVLFTYKQPCRYDAYVVSTKTRDGYHHVMRFNAPNLLACDDMKAGTAFDIILHECIHMLVPASHHGTRFKNLCAHYGVNPSRYS